MTNAQTLPSCAGDVCMLAVHSHATLRPDPDDDAAAEHLSFDRPEAWALTVLHVDNLAGPDSMHPGTCSAGR